MVIDPETAERLGHTNAAKLLVFACADGVLDLRPGPKRQRLVQGDVAHDFAVPETAVQQHVTHTLVAHGRSVDGRTCEVTTSGAAIRASQDVRRSTAHDCQAQRRRAPGAVPVLSRTPIGFWGVR